MDIYLTNLATSDRLQFPMLPTDISVKTAQQFATYSILRMGEVKIPSGTSADSFSWQGILPGAVRRNETYVRSWQEPKAIYNWLNNLKVIYDKPVKARLLITETPINCDVYLSSFTAAPTGGYGDIDYDITLVQARNIIVRKSGEKTPAAALNATTPAENMLERPAPPAAQTYMVVKGDSLWKIAQKFYGNGADYSKIYAANKGTIGSNPSQITPGQVFTIP